MYSPMESPFLLVDDLQVDTGHGKAELSSSVQKVLSLGAPLTDGNHTGGDQSWTPGRLVETQHLVFVDLCHTRNKLYDNKISKIIITFKMYNSMCISHPKFFSPAVCSQQFANQLFSTNKTDLCSLVSNGCKCCIIIIIIPYFF